MGKKFKTIVTLKGVRGHYDDDGPSYIDLAVTDAVGEKRILRWPFYSRNEDMAFRAEIGKRLWVKGTSNPQVHWYDLGNFMFMEE